MSEKKIKKLKLKFNLNPEKIKKIVGNYKKTEMKTTPIKNIDVSE